MKRTKKKENKKEEQLVEQNEQSISNSAYESSFDTSFFYTNDKFLNQLDNDEIYKTIQNKFKTFDLESTDSVIKKTIVQILEDENFVNYILQYYNINIYEFFKLIYKRYSSVFKGPYLKKIKTRIQNKSYIANGRKQKDY